MTTPPLDDAALDELERLWEASTPGEWVDDVGSKHDDGSRSTWIVTKDSPPGSGKVVLSSNDRYFGSHAPSEEDRAFIAASHNVMPALLSRIRDDAEKIRRLREALKRSWHASPSDYSGEGVMWTDAEIDAIEKGESHA